MCIWTGVAGDIKAINDSGIRFRYDDVWAVNNGYCSAHFAAWWRCIAMKIRDLADRREPIQRKPSELGYIGKMIRHCNADCNDGDADRIGTYDADGNFVDSPYYFITDPLSA